LFYNLYLVFFFVKFVFMLDLFSKHAGRPFPHGGKLGVSVTAVLKWDVPDGGLDLNKRLDENGGVVSSRLFIVGGEASTDRQAHWDSSGVSTR